MLKKYYKIRNIKNNKNSGKISDKTICGNIAERGITDEKNKRIERKSCQKADRYREKKEKTDRAHTGSADHFSVCLLNSKGILNSDEETAVS